MRHWRSRKEVGPPPKTERQFTSWLGQAGIPYLYVATVLGQQRPMKIGMSRNLAARSLSYGPAGVSIRFALIVEDGEALPKLENAILSWLKSDRIRGEWFDIEWSLGAALLLHHDQLSGPIDLQYLHRLADGARNYMAGKTITFLTKGGFSPDTDEEKWYWIGWPQQ